MIKFRKVFSVSWQFPDHFSRRRQTPRWSMNHATLATEEVVDQDNGRTFCGVKIPWDIIRGGPGFHEDLKDSKVIDCNSCQRSIQSLRDAGEW